MGNLLKQPFTRYVREQIEVRQEVHGRSQNRSPEEISYLNSRNAWVKLSSAIWLEGNRIDYLKSKNGQNNPLMDGIGGDEDLARKYVLFNGLSDSYGSTARAGITSPNTPNGAYGVGGTDFGYSPMPGIINASIKDLNRGSLKEATVNIKVQNKNQFDIIETLYMRIGYYILLEWGVNKYLTKEDGELKLVNQISTVGDFKWWKYKAKITKDKKKLLEASNSEVNKVLRDIERFRKENKGNYDALFGVITNFSWTFNPDGSYDVVLRINSVGDVIESLKINTPAGVKVNKSQPNPQNVGDFETIKKLYQDDPVPQSAFYDVLYPGLKESLQTFYRAMQNKLFHNVFGGIKNVGSFGRTKYQAGEGYEYIFDVKDLGSQFLFNLFYKNQDLKLEYISPPNLSPELQDNQSIINEILPDPNLSSVELSGGTSDISIDELRKLSNTNNWVAGFFYDVLKNRLEDDYGDVILVKHVKGPPATGESIVRDDSRNGGGISRRVFTSPEKGDPLYTVELEFRKISKLRWLGQNEVIDRQRYLKPGKKTKVTKTPVEDRQEEGWDGYADNKENRLRSLSKGYGAKAAGALWPGVRAGWFMLHLGLDELLRGMDAYFEFPPPVETGPISLYEVSRKWTKETNPQEIPNFPDNKTISELIFMLCDEEKFLTYVYDLFVDADRAGSDDDPRFELPEEDDITEEITEVSAYETELEEKRNKNAIFNWFYKIRKLYPLYTYKSIISSNDGELGNILDTSLDTLPKIALFSNKQNREDFREIGRIINPFEHNFQAPGSVKGGLNYSDAAVENLQDQVEDQIDDFDQPTKGIDKDDNPKSLVNKLKNAADQSGKVLSAPQQGLVDIVNLAYIEPSEKVKKWNSEIEFPNYTLSKSRDFAFLFVSPISNAYYVRLGVLLKFLEKNVVFTLDNRSPVINFDTNSENNICYTIDNVISTNITKCLIANPNFYGDTFGLVPQFFEVFQNLDSYIGNVDGYYYGKIMNIYFSFSRIEQILQGVDTKNEINLFTFLKALTDDINELNL
jgi:hypothetical protein